jgi:hypothetical protein
VTIEWAWLGIGFVEGVAAGDIVTIAVFAVVVAKVARKAG